MHETISGQGSYYQRSKDTGLGTEHDHGLQHVARGQETWSWNHSHWRSETNVGKFYDREPTNVIPIAAWPDLTASSIKRKQFRHERLVRLYSRSVHTKCWHDKLTKYHVETESSIGGPVAEWNPKCTSYCPLWAGPQIKEERKCVLEGFNGDYIARIKHV